MKFPGGLWALLPTPVILPQSAEVSSALLDTRTEVKNALLDTRIGAYDHISEEGVYNYNAYSS